MADRLTEIEALIATVRKHGLCPAEEACTVPDPTSSDCAGCIAGWEALDALGAALAPAEKEPGQ